ncbi:hypothetical protein [uncultured Tissierella sp.]|uniref:hypothetical protein n=1 Tax=uncultured Tissierella sp. TaxID=448160 RepID=UPI00280559B2|nr:hypothetical protein [uncultured Tissierella sp.]MDU5080281.1 hypothetical protein [Bacillota bacterium]
MKMIEIENMSKAQIEANIKYLLEEKTQLENDIKTGEEAKRAIVFTKEKLNNLMARYIEA